MWVKDTCFGQGGLIFYHEPPYAAGHYEICSQFPLNTSEYPNLRSAQQSIFPAVWLQRIPINTGNMDTVSIQHGFIVRWGLRRAFNTFNSKNNPTSLRNFSPLSDNIVSAGKLQIPDYSLHDAGKAMEIMG